MRICISKKKTNNKKIKEKKPLAFVSAPLAVGNKYAAIALLYFQLYSHVCKYVCVCIYVSECVCMRKNSASE